MANELIALLLRKVCPCFSLYFVVGLMKLILDGDLEIGAHVRSNLYYLFCLRHSIRSSSATNQIFSLRKDIFSLYACATISEFWCWLDELVRGMNSECILDKGWLGEMVSNSIVLSYFLHMTDFSFSLREAAKKFLSPLSSIGGGGGVKPYLPVH